MSTNYTLFANITEQKNTQPFISGTQAFMKNAGLECQILADTNGDGGYEGLYENEFIFLFANARNMALAAKHGGTLLCCDDVSYCNMKETLAILKKDGDLNARINQKLSPLELHFDGQNVPIHINDLILEILDDDQIKHRFEGFNVAVHYGNDFGRMQHHRDSSAMLTIAQQLGAKAYDVQTSAQFSGYETLFANETVAFHSAGEILLDCIDSGADFILTSNAASFYMLDSLNRHAACRVNRETKISILHPAQMACLALGLTDKKSLGLDQHTNPVTLI